jgi:predicted transglutaminase-like cysteine proteinase
MITNEDIAKMVETTKIVDGRRHIGKRQTKVMIDPRGFVVPDDVIIQMRMESDGGPWKGRWKMNNIKKYSESEKLELIQRWVATNVFYQSDEKTHGLPDVWQTPAETLTINAGDCEDGAILLASMLLNAGLKSDDIWIAVGPVEKEHNAADGYHAWVMYRSKGQWYPIDWCYQPQITAMKFRDPIEKRPCYIAIDWMFSQKQTLRRPLFGRMRKLMEGEK